MASSNRTVSNRYSKISLNTVLESYAAYYASGPSHTARAKRNDLRKFSDFLKNYRKVTKLTKLVLGDWDYSATQAYVDSCLVGGEAPTTVARRLATLRHLGRILAEEHLGFINPTRGVKAPRSNQLKPKGLTSTEISAILKKAQDRINEKNSFIRSRNQTIFLLMISTGLRADEVRLLRLNQLSPELDWIKNVKTKGRKFRNVYINSELRPILEAYFAKRTLELKRFFPNLNKKLNVSLPVFISSYNVDLNKPDSFLMGSKTLWRAVQELSTEHKLHPHLLRHSYALTLLQHTNDIRLVSQALGHGDVRITMRYTERDEVKVAEAMEKIKSFSQE